MKWTVRLGAGFLLLALEFLAATLAKEYTKHLTLLPSLIMLRAALGV